MSKPADNADDSAELRRRAQAELGGRPESLGSKPEDQKSEPDTRRLLHELEVHQIELEMQNEALSEARNKLEVLLEKYTDLYDFAPVGYLTLDVAGNVCEANLAAANLLQVARSALVKRDFGNFISAGDRAAFGIFLREIFAAKTRHTSEVMLNVAGQPPIAVELEGIVFASGGGACRLIMRDITELKRAEADRLILNKLESTGILAGGIAHDFNNLLTAILLNLELAQMLAPPGGELERYLEEARKSGRLARSLTAQLVTFSGGGTPIRRAMLLSGLIQEAVRLALSDSMIRSEFSLAKDLSLAEVDEAQIGQVIRGIALNAREAMPEGGVLRVRAVNVLRSASDHPSLPAGDYVQVSFEDQGPGIPSDLLPKIFDPYFSTKQRGSRKGMGLGLTICHSIIRKHAGAITVESAMGVGTSVIILLPAARMLSYGAKAPPRATIPPRQRLLIMTDEEAIRQAVGQTLSGMGHTVVWAQNGQTAIEKYKTTQQMDAQFEVVILALTVREGMGGLETLQALLQLDPGVKAIAMNGNVRDPELLEPGRHGFKAVLTKPFEAGKLREILARVLGTAPGERTFHE